MEEGEGKNWLGSRLFQCTQEGSSRMQSYVPHPLNCKKARQNWSTLQTGAEVRIELLPSVSQRLSQPLAYCLWGCLA